MVLEWTDSLDAVDWEELSNLYRVAPLYLKLGFKRMLTPMAIFQDQAQAVETELVADNAR